MSAVAVRPALTVGEPRPGNGKQTRNEKRFNNAWCPRPELNWDQRFRKQFSLLHDGKQKTTANIGSS